LKHKNSKFLCGLVSVLLAVVSLCPAGEVFNGSAPPPEALLSLWYRQPATDWESQALPIGNGYIGGMVFGGVSEERIQLNEKTLWSGGPGDSAGIPAATAPTGRLTWHRRVCCWNKRITRRAWDYMSNLTAMGKPLVRIRPLATCTLPFRGAADCVAGRKRPAAGCERRCR
jgi:hypothetical protein